MKILKTARAVQNLIKKERCSGKTVGFVPTMGCLHEGHLSLIRRAKKENDNTVVSIFVNPKQFSPREDFSRYPRNKKHDEYLLQKEKVDIIFYPSAEEMYPHRYLTYVEVERLSSILCGQFRPGHFKGVATIVTKLFNIVMPDTAYFGQKDAQQAVIIAKMADDLNFPLKIKILPTVREADGLALSSRNRYLDPQQRRDAVVLFKALQQARRMIRAGARDAAGIKRTMATTIRKKPSVSSLDYIAIVDAKTLAPVRRIQKNKILIALAVRIKATRLIDNCIVTAP